MGSRKHKKLTFSDYLALSHNRLADNLTVSQIQQVLYIHGLRSLSCKEEMVDAVSSLDMIPATRSTINSDISQLRCESAKSAVCLGEVKQDIHDIGWEECPIGSIIVVPESTSSPTSQKKRRKKTNGKKIKDEKHDLQSSLSEERATKGAKELKPEVSKTIHVLATSLQDVDNCSWINRGSQMIKGFTVRRFQHESHRRNMDTRGGCGAYFKCKKVGCQAMKYVNQDPKDGSMCIVTYKGKHSHPIP